MIAWKFPIGMQDADNSNEDMSHGGVRGDPWQDQFLHDFILEIDFVEAVVQFLLIAEAVPPGLVNPKVLTISGKNRNVKLQ